VRSEIGHTVEVETFSLSDQSLFGNVLKASPWSRVRGGCGERKILGEGVWCLVGKEINSAKTELCDF